MFSRGRAARARATDASRSADVGYRRVAGFVWRVASGGAGLAAMANTGVAVVGNLLLLFLILGLVSSCVLNTSNRSLRHTSHALCRSQIHTSLTSRLTPSLSSIITGCASGHPRLPGSIPQTNWDRDWFGVPVRVSAGGWFFKHTAVLRKRPGAWDTATSHGVLARRELQ